MDPLRVRVELADQPGALAGLTTALAALDVDVTSMEVLEVDGRTVVDEMLLSLPTGTSQRDVEDVLRLGGALDVLSTRADYAHRDASVRALEIAADMLTSPGDASAPGRALAAIAYADAGALLGVEEAARYPLAQRARDLGVATTGRAHPDASPLAVPTGWVLWLVPGVDRPQHVAVVGRRLDVRFSATEAARLRALVTLLEKVSLGEP